MTVIVDTREKKNAHILKYFARHDVEYIEKKMDIADYGIEGDLRIVIDRKQNLDELSRNLLNAKDKSRFWKEVRRAHAAKVKMIVLCEHGGQIKTIPDVASWHSKYSPVSGRSLMERIYDCHIAYGVDFLFCDKRSTGRRILELLHYGEL